MRSLISSEGIDVICVFSQYNAEAIIIAASSAEGVIEHSPGGGFELDKARRAYIRWRGQRPTRSASQANARDLDRDE